MAKKLSMIVATLFGVAACHSPQGGQLVRVSAHEFARLAQEGGGSVADSDAWHVMSPNAHSSFVGLSKQSPDQADPRVYMEFWADKADTNSVIIYWVPLSEFSGTTYTRIIDGDDPFTSPRVGDFFSS
tara:strand:+ start:945 stop:1328 length:384 start_codon:yes stop_codon:yes gene_type:complete